MIQKIASPRITVVIPTLEEETTIASIIRGCKPHADEIIVIDGYSADRTREIASELGAEVIFDHKKGKERLSAIPFPT